MPRRWVSRVANAADVQAGLRTYQAERSLEALKLQSAARNRMEWFENVARYANLERVSSPTPC